MITGVVDEFLEAIINVRVLDARGEDREIKTVIDTGFNGSLTLPSDIIHKLNLPWRTSAMLTLGNGSHALCDVYAATIVWGGTRRDILVEAAEVEPLLGTALLKGCCLEIEVAPGGSVKIAPL